MLNIEELLIKIIQILDFDMKDVKLKFILVVKNAEDITWLAGPLAELRARLLKVRKIWGVEVVVLNEELAGEYNLTC